MSASYCSCNFSKPKYSATVLSVSRFVVAQYGRFFTVRNDGDLASVETLLPCRYILTAFARRSVEDVTREYRVRPRDLLR